MPSTTDLVIIALTVLLPLLFFFRNSLPFIGAKPASANGVYANGHGPRKKEEGGGDPRDFVGKMEKGVSGRVAS